MSEAPGGGAALTTGPSEPDIDESLIVHGSIHVRRTHPNLYRNVMAYAILCIALGLNFWILSPTFLIYDMPNQLWGTIFLVLGVSELVLLNAWRNLRLMRAVMALGVAGFLFVGAGTTQPFFEGQGSLQLPILYFVCGASLFWFLIEPFINPWTARRDA